MSLRVSGTLTFCRNWSLVISVAFSSAWAKFVVSLYGSCEMLQFPSSSKSLQVPTRCFLFCDSRNCLKVIMVYL